MRNATDIFNEWALGGKDKGMEKNHAAAVKEMLSYLTRVQEDPFTFIDAGCGNGWVVRKMKEHPLCEKAIGVDGAEDMIRKANTNDAIGNYFCSDLLEWAPEEKVDFIHSM
ncbi:MAG TPA: methyltransferase domain-containing protein, partial [Candidatus Marinimicrobia bacterium]|nr:methyltransferase domain-containing protein [Candidatus Neomarinimicrobiota bacterium]